VLIPICVEVLLGVVDGHSAVDTGGQGIVGHDGDALVGPVRVLEEKDGGPVVAAEPRLSVSRMHLLVMEYQPEVLAEDARCACSLLANVTGHVGGEGIASDNLNTLVQAGR